MVIPTKDIKAPIPSNILTFSLKNIIDIGIINIGLVAAKVLTIPTFANFIASTNAVTPKVATIVPNTIYIIPFLFTIPSFMFDHSFF